MADPKVRFCAVYINKKKAATVNNVSVSHNIGGVDAIGQEGFFATTDGIDMTEIDVTGIIPVAGSSGSEILEKILNHEQLTFALTYADKILQYTGKATAHTITSARETGLSTENMKFRCGPPTVTG